MNTSTAEPAGAVEQLAASTRPFLIGVRHHSPAVASAVPALLDGFKPDLLAVELPPQFQPWIEWLSHPETVAPVALAGSSEPLAFYPFADFSLSWQRCAGARRHEVEVVAFDLPIADAGWEGRSSASQPAIFATALRASQSGRDGDDLWDRVVEAAAPGSTPEQVRRAALAVGWAIRSDEGADVSSVDLRREEHMRAILAEHSDRRCAAVIGAFHAPALISGTARLAASTSEVVTSLIPYTEGLLDSRSGYPSGIRDPRWQSMVLDSGGDPDSIAAAAVGLVVEVCSAVRIGGHPAGPGEAREIMRIAADLASLRGLPAPARGELVEALNTVLVQGEPLGRGRVVASAMETVLVGDRRGRLAPGTPRSGLAPAVEQLLRELRLPHPEDPARRELRLDPLRSPLDRRREVALQRLLVCGVPYAEPLEVAGVGAADGLTTRWFAEWTPTVAAMLEVAALLGVTVAQASAGVLRQMRTREESAGGSTARQAIDGLHAAAQCGLPELVVTRLQDAASVLPHTGTLVELLEGLDVLSRLARGSLPGLPEPLPIESLAVTLHEAAVRQVDGLAGSTDVADARALLALVVLREDSAMSLRLDDALRRIATGGSPLMRGAAAAIRVALGLDEAAALGVRAAGWLDLEQPEELMGRLAGLLVVAAPLLEAGGDALEPLIRRLELMSDALFLRRLPAVRGGFDAISVGARSRLLSAVEARLDDRLDLVLDTDPLLLAQWAEADAAGLAALNQRGLMTTIALAPHDRWRLVLGQKRKDLPPAAGRYAVALDELYGMGRGEGSRGDLSPVGNRGGSEPSYPSVREWAEELTQLFGPLVREEVLAAAAATGRLDAALMLNPNAARPSVELLTTVLSLAGGLPEETVARLRPLISRVVADLTRQLANTLSPALVGIMTSRPTRRAGGPLDLRRTVAANLRTARHRADGSLMIVPERPIFSTRAKRTTDWRMVLVVDVSGSMEASVVWSAITAAVLSGVPALTTHLLAFSTEVVDLTGLVSDPLSLLLEVSVGGGTSIATGLAAARQLVTVPSRTMVVVVSDFEEGGPIGPLLAEARALIAAGVHVLGCASLDERGAPRYSVGVASQLVAAGMPVAALSPLELARWVAEQVT